MVEVCSEGVLASKPCGSCFHLHNQWYQWSKGWRIGRPRLMFYVDWVGMVQKILGEPGTTFLRSFLAPVAGLQANSDSIIFCMFLRFKSATRIRGLFRSKSCGVQQTMQCLAAVRRATCDHNSCEPGETEAWRQSTEGNFLLNFCIVPSTWFWRLGLWLFPKILQVLGISWRPGSCCSWPTRSSLP